MAQCSYVVLSLLSIIALVTCCYDECMHTFNVDMDRISPGLSNSSSLNTDFCRAMSNQIQCLYIAKTNCPPQQKTLIDSLLTVFIQPDYRRTCGGDNDTGDATNSTAAAPSKGSNIFTGSSLASTGAASFTSLIPTSGRTLLICRQKFQTCQINFNQTFTASMALYNISGLCQSLKQYTICFISLLSSECGHLVPRNVVYNMQKNYGGMCSNDAQANTYTMIQCANLTMKCYVQFNTTFAPAVGDYDLKIMCSAIDRYTICMQNVSNTGECASFIQQSSTGIQQLKRRHNAYCGEDNGQTASQCVQSFQDCFSPFNKTFFPGLHATNLTVICSSLSTYSSCMSRLTPTCSQQFGSMLQSVQTLQTQFAQKCHPNIIKLASCEQIGQCSQVFMKNYSTGMTSSSGFCRGIGDYFPCIERSLDNCRLPQSTTEISFGGLGVLMKGYCNKLSSNVNLIRCSAFVKCTAAIWATFNPSIRNMYEGSTWCTFLQLSIGCAEHALQSSSCFLEGDVTLGQSIREIDQLRVQTCEKEVTLSNEKSGGAEENLADPSHLKQSDGKDGNSAPGSHKPITTTLLLLLLAHFTLYGRLHI